MVDRTPLPIGPELGAVALDANATGSLPQVPKIRDLARLLDEQEMPTEIWIPEPVLWEWAEHTWNTLQDIVGPLNQLSKTGITSFAGLRGSLPSGLEEVLEDLEGELAEIERVRVIRLNTRSEVAVNAVRDQVLQFGAASRKGSDRTKTGASDSATLRLIQAEVAELAEDGVAIVSGDKDFLRHLGNDDSLILVKDWGLLWASVIAAVPSDSALSEQVLRAATTHLQNAAAKQDLAGILLEGPYSTHLRGLEYNYSLERRIRLSAVNRFGSPSVGELSRRDGYASIGVSATVGVEVETVWHDPYRERIEQDSELLPDLPAHLRLAAQQSDGVWEVEIVSAYLEDEDSEGAGSILREVERGAGELWPLTVEPLESRGQKPSGERAYVPLWRRSRKTLGEQ